MSGCTSGAYCRRPSFIVLTVWSGGSPGHRNRGLPGSGALSENTCCHSDVSGTAGGDQLEEQVGGLGLEGDVADLVDDEQWVAAEPVELGLQPAGGMVVGEAGDPFGDAYSRRSQRRA